MLSTQVLLLLAFSLLLHKGQGRTSYTSDGVWEKVVDQDKAAECSHYLCTPDGLIWRQKSAPAIFYNYVNGCEALAKKGITKISFYGDSYMRHLYQSMLITLNGNFKSGSQNDRAINNSSNPCLFHSQFNEKLDCRELTRAENATVCGNRVTLEPLLNNVRDHDRRPIYKQPNGTVVLWSFGNHPIEVPGKPGRFNVNNATAYQELFENDGFCPYYRDNKDRFLGEAGGADVSYSMWWVSTHYRMAALNPDETPDFVRNFNLDMRKWVDSDKCGNTNYIDVYNMTERLAVDFQEQTAKMTFDKVHWGMEVNLIKAQLVLNALLS